MSKSVVINLGHGNLKKGFPKVAAQLWEAGHSQPEQFIGSLPPAPQLEDLYKNWRTIYQSLCDRVAVRDEHRKFLRNFVDDDDLEVESFGITNVSEFSFEDLCRELEAGMNAWLKSEELLSLSRQLRSALHKSEEIRVIFESDDDLLRRLPWHRCDFFRDYPKAEISIAQPEYHRNVCSNLPTQRQQVRILAILGNDQGIDLDAEIQCLSDLTDCYVNFVRNPSRQEFNNCLWDSLGWDMIFFAGHSQTVGDTGRLYINNDKTNNSLTIEQLSEALNAAIDKGLKLAIFNSCDGMGLANTLAPMHIPTTIVMREPVPNRVAEVFFKNFLTAFAIQRLPLYLAVQQARRQLQGLEDEFPGASWLPVICQNPAIEPPNWLNLGGIPPCPYRGLFAFREQDALFFFGREQFTRDLVTAVKRKPLVAVIGPSGSGKSSVVFAGLVPHLRRDTICPWEIISFRPGNSPIAALTNALAHLPPPRSQSGAGNAYPLALPLVKNVSQPIVTRIQEGQQAEPARMHSQLQTGNEIQPPSTLYRTIEQFVQQNSGTRLVLIVDQFEELYTLCPEPERQYFLNALLTAVEKAPAFTLVITLRADFYGYALSDRNLSDALQGAVLNLAPMNQQELYCAIATPAAKMQVHLEGGLTNRLISAVEGYPGRLPLLEFALTQLWSKQHQGMLTNQAYEEIGGVESALANHAEAEYAQLEERDRNRAQRIFMQLIQPGEGIEATRRIATKEEVKQENWDLVTRLASSRLVVTNRNEFTGEETVEIVHEALVRSWGRLEHWLQLDGEFRNWQEQLRSAIRQWERSNGDEGTILRGKPLVDAEYWYKLRSDELSASDRAFVELSLEVRNREYQKQQKRRRVTVFGLSVGLVLALLLAGVAMRQSRRANIREVEAISRSSQALLASNNRLDALVNAIAAFAKLQKYNFFVPDDTKALVKSTLQEATYGAAWLQKPSSGVAEFNRLRGHTAAIYTTAVSPDSQVIATGSADKTIKLWQPDGKLITTLTGHDGTVWKVAFSPDGGVMATASSDKTVKLWKRYGASYTLLRTLNIGAEVYAVAFSPDGDIATGDKNQLVKLWDANGRFLTSLEGHNDAVSAVKFSGDGQFMASASDDGTVRIWKKHQAEYELLHILKGHEGVVKTVAFGPDSEIIATAGADKTVKLWKLDGTLINTWDGHNDSVYEVAFSPNGQTIATASQDKTIKLWQRDGKLITTLAGDSDRIYAVAFSPNGKTIISAGRSRIAKLWKIGKTPLTTLNGHTDQVWGVAFSPDGQNIVSGGFDKTIKLWKPDGTLIRSFIGHEDRIYGIAFSPDGKTIASVSRDKTIKLQKADGTLINILRGHREWVAGVAFSPDGQIIASASNDNTVKLWKINGTLIKTLYGHTKGVNAVAFSPNGEIIASASSDRKVKLWNRDGTLLRTLISHNDQVTAVAFSADSKTIASASLDRTIKLWKSDGTLIKTLNQPDGHTDAVRAVAFSPNGKMIASARIDKTIKLWKTDGTLITTLSGHGDAITRIAFSPDSQKIASASSDKTVIVWDLNRVLDLDKLLAYDCEWVSDYLKTNPLINSDNSATSEQEINRFCSNVGAGSPRP